MRKQSTMSGSLRPSDARTPSFVHVREISTVDLSTKHKNVWPKSLVIFGNTVEGSTVAIHINGFPWYCYVKATDWTEDTVEEFKIFVQKLNPNCRGSIVIDARFEERIRLCGFNFGRKDRLLRVECANAANMYQLRKADGQDMEMPDGSHVHIQLYHTNWYWDALLMHQTGIRVGKWIQLPHAPFAMTPKVTTSTFEFDLHYQDIRPCEAAPDGYPLHMYLVVSLRIRAYKPGTKHPVQPRSAHDPLIAYSARFYWVGGKEGTAEASFASRDETTVLAHLSDAMHLHQPDVLLVCEDNYSDLQYIQRRLAKHNMPSSVLSRLKDVKMFDFRDSLVHAGCSKFDLKEHLREINNTLKTKLEGYTLIDAAEHDGIYPHPVTEEEADDDPLQLGMMNQQAAEQKALERVRLESLWMTVIEQSGHRIVGVAEMSSLVCCSYTDIVSRGQQIRIWSYLCTVCHNRGFYINPEILYNGDMFRVPAMVDVSYDSCPYPPFVRPGQTECRVDAAYKLTGGFVHTPYTEGPEKGFFEEPVGTLDFASLYPSIIIAYLFCYSRLVFPDTIDAVMADDSIKKFYVRYNGVCMVYVCDERFPSIVNTAIAQLLAMRKAVKGQMKHAHGFEKAVLDAKQLGIKITQNSMYGFLGTKLSEGGKLPCIYIQRAVCQMGRFMNLDISHYAQTGPYDLEVVYGDTDSIMVRKITPLLDDQGRPVDYTTEEGLRTYWAYFARVAKDMSTHFPAPNDLEMEQIKYPAKFIAPKVYIAMGLELRDDGSFKRGMVYKGISGYTRAKTPFTRGVCKDIGAILMQLPVDFEAIRTRIRDAAEQIASGNVPVRQLTRTVLMGTYKKSKVDLIQVLTAKKITERTGREYLPGVRMAYVIVDGKEKQAHRGEDPQHVEENGIKLDLAHYVDGDLRSGAGQMLRFMEDKVDMDKLLAPSVMKCLRSKHRVESARDFFSAFGTSKRKAK